MTGTFQRLPDGRVRLDITGYLDDWNDAMHDTSPLRRIILDAQRFEVASAQAAPTEADTP